jgi:hypothetical protein
MADPKTIEEMNLHELRDWKMQVMAELKAVMARIHELELIEAGLGAVPPVKEPGTNAHPEGEDVPPETAA